MPAAHHHHRKIGIGLLVRRSLRQHLLSTCVTALSVALASGLVMAVFAISKQSREAFTGGPVGFDAVLGARGSKLQLVLNTVFHLETSPGNIPYAIYKTVKANPQVELAIPYAVGDNYQGFRIVGTTPEIFTKFEYQKGRKFQLQKSADAQPSFFQEDRAEAVIGSFVARKTGLKVGSTFNPYHGLDFNPKEKHNNEYVVTGVLEPTNSPSDRVIWIPIEGIYRMSGHVLRGTGKTLEAKAGETIPDEAKEVSAVMLKLKSQAAGMMLSDQINRQGDKYTLAWPIAQSMGELFDKLGWMSRVLQMVAYLVMAVATGSILASVYNTINERRREFAIMRALGARRRTVFSAIVIESAAIAAIGAAGGFLVYLAIVKSAAVVVQAQTGVVLDVMQVHRALWATPLAMIVLGAIAGVLPAIRAYSTDVAANLSPST